MPEDLTYDRIENRPIVSVCIMDMERYKMKIPLIDLDVDKW